MPSEHSLRKRKQPQVAQVFNATDNPDNQGSPWSEDEQDIHLPWLQRLIICKRRITGNFWPTIQNFSKAYPNIDRVLKWMTVWITLATVLVLVFFSPTLEPRFKTLSPWHVELHNAWLRDHKIHETTWILSEEALDHTSNEPYLIDNVLLQFPQSNGGAGFTLRDVTFDPKAHYGVISMKKLEEHHVPLRILFGLGEAGRPVVGVEVMGQDIVAVVWGGKGTYLLKAWTLSRCEYSLIRPLCLWWYGRDLNDIPAETMRELVDKHRTIPASAEGMATPWEQRALDQKEKKKKTKKGFWGS